MDLEPTLEEMNQKSGVIHPDILGDKRTDPANGAFCKSSKPRCGLQFIRCSFKDSISCGCVLCRLNCTMYRLTNIGRALWRMGRGEVKTRLLEFEKQAPFKHILYLFDSYGWKISNENISNWNMSNGNTGEEYIGFFQIEGMPHLPIQRKPLLILLTAHTSFGDLPVLKPLPEFTGSDESFQLAKMWLEDCLEKHSQSCSLSQKPAPLPKRVLDLGDCPDGIRLLEDSDETAPYICLSHCWGDKAYHPLQTTSQNISSHRRGVPFAYLPKTFQEAATIVRRLGYKYLWIDSLCIIQDDKEDWRVQASRMADIYQGCLLTIAAAAAANSAQGLFSHISPESRGVLLSDLTEQEYDSNVWIRQILLHKREPLETRGWVLQERALSPRTLYFGKDELFWVCLEAAVCQCNQWHNPSNTLKSKIHRVTKGYPRPREDVFRDWYSVVEEYSYLQLSREEDIFPAISGISKQFRTLLGSQYIAGLWRDSIPRGLSWKVSDIKPGRARRSTKGRARRSTKWRAPSFSWANVVLSQGFHIYYSSGLDESDHQCVKLIDVHCVPVGTDDTGQLSDAYVDLEGTLVAATIRNLAGNWLWFLKSDSHSFRYTCVYPDYDYDIDGPHQIVDGNEVFCLLVSEKKLDSPGWTRRWLILRETERRQDVRDDCGDNTENIPVYERVGLLEEDGDMLLPPCLQARPVDLDGIKVVVRIQ
jgi:hypothetical protein